MSSCGRKVEGDSDSVEEDGGSEKDENGGMAKEKLEKGRDAEMCDTESSLKATRTPTT